MPATAEAESNFDKPTLNKKMSKKSARKNLSAETEPAEESTVTTRESDNAFAKPKKSKSNRSESSSKLNDLLENMVQDASASGGFDTSGISATHGTNNEFDKPKVKKKRKSKKSKRKRKADSSEDDSEKPKLKKDKSKLRKPKEKTPPKSKYNKGKEKKSRKRDKMKEKTDKPIDGIGEALAKEDEKKSEDEPVRSGRKKKMSKKDMKKSKDRRNKHKKDKAKRDKAKRAKEGSTDEEGKKAKKGKKKEKGLDGKSSHSNDSKGSRRSKGSNGSKGRKKLKKGQSRRRGRKEDFEVKDRMNGDEYLLTLADQPFGAMQNQNREVDKALMLSTHSLYTNEEEQVPADNDPMICIRINRIQRKLTELRIKTQQEIYYMDQHTEREKDALMEKIGMSNDPEEAIGHIQRARIKDLNNQDKRLTLQINTLDQEFSDEIALATKLTTEAQEMQLQTASLVAHIQRKEEKIARNSLVVANLAYMDRIILGTEV
jgi:hypothetical protein